MILKLRPFSKNLDSHMNHSNNSSPLSQWPTEKSNLKSEVFNYLLYYRDQRLIAEFVVLRPHGSHSAQRIIRTKSFLKRVFSIFFADLHIKPAAFALQVNSVMISQSESQFSQWKWNPASSAWSTHFLCGIYLVLTENNFISGFAAEKTVCLDSAEFLWRED